MISAYHPEDFMAAVKNAFGITDITREFGSVKYMKEAQALIIRDLVKEYGLSNFLEIGFFHGKSSIYMGAILREIGKGHLLTIDLEGARKKSPNIIDLIDATGFADLITPVFAHRSYTWELAKLIRDGKRELFDFCYLDGGHTFDVTALGVMLVSALMKPGGILVIDDLDWSMANSKHYQEHPEQADKYSIDEQNSQGIRIVWNKLLPEVGFKKIREVPEHSWGIAQYM
jgi:predicted O-methyltransferase YrrM